ncbi:MAG: amino acid adenylation domain-containing protein [Actinomycetota bacterium]|nr:amino acid adenylation domain-containing protein [Actinomycetota bacterium]
MLDGLREVAELRDVLKEHEPDERRALIEFFISDWHRTLEDVDDRPEPDQPLYLQSLQAADLGVLLEACLGVAAPLEDLVGEQTLTEMAERLAESAPANGDAAPEDVPLAEPQPDERHEPFELTDIQQAYLVGRTRMFELGGVSTHLYFEFERDDLDVDRLARALSRVIERHDMLRAEILEDGRQRVLEHVEPYEIARADLSSLAPEEAEARLEAVREELSHQVLPAGRWPMFEVRASRLGGGRTRVHVSIDLLIADGHSILLVLRDWGRFYENPEAELPPPAITFRDYLAARKRLTATEAYEEARGYWRERLSTLPPAPDLPLARQPAAETPRFVRREDRLDAETWGRLCERAQRIGVTPSALLCTVYSSVLAAWAAEPRFTLNLTLRDALPLHPEVDEVVGDFTSSILLEVEDRPGESFEANAQRLHTQLTSDLDHRLFSGVKVQRELARASGGTAPRMPVVFTSLIGTAVPEEAIGVRELVCALTQTPQVHLDHQAIELDGELLVVWDAVDDLFPDGMLDAMFAAYGRLLRDLAEDADEVPRAALLPAAQIAERDAANATEQPYEEQLLHAGIDRQVAERPDEPAVIADGRTLTYRELDERANRVARRLRELGVRPDELVGVVMDKGWEQVVAVLGIVRSGAAYLPISASLPDKRVLHLLENGEVSVALTQSAAAAAVPWPDGVRALAVDDDTAWEGVDAGPVEDGAQPSDLAYVIFTSGSTGLPKGVMIEHRAAANTVVDCNTRFRLTPEDRVLALSSLSFDLSVFDVFGALRAGAAIVMPEAGAMRDPARWAELVREHRVTIWNSVPALLDMAVEFADGRPAALGPSLRLAMMSGDWIPVDLPERLRRLVPDVEIVGMGGATEASIWSILHSIESVDPGWSSIPYGRPMANQTFHVLDDELEPRPVWAPGELFIGGIGLARGYWRDPAQTAERFIEHPRTGERLYRTGDLGRYLPGGDIEFLGRRDSQVKIRGYRVELGEIEAALNEHEGIRSAVVVAAGERQGPKRLVAYHVPEGEELAACDLRSFLGARLPEYMVPQLFMALDRLPLTSNG